MGYCSFISQRLRLAYRPSHRTRLPANLEHNELVRTERAGRAHVTQRVKCCSLMPLQSSFKLDLLFKESHLLLTNGTPLLELGGLRRLVFWYSFYSGYLVSRQPWKLFG